MSTKRRTLAEAQARYARALADWKAAKRYERRLDLAYEKAHAAGRPWSAATLVRTEAAEERKWARAKRGLLRAGAAVLRALGGPPAKELA